MRERERERERERDDHSYCWSVICKSQNRVLHFSRRFIFRGCVNWQVVMRNKWSDCQSASPGPFDLPFAWVSVIGDSFLLCVHFFMCPRNVLAFSFFFPLAKSSQDAQKVNTQKSQWVGLLDDRNFHWCSMDCVIFLALANFTSIFPFLLLCLFTSCFPLPFYSGLLLYLDRASSSSYQWSIAPVYILYFAHLRTRFLCKYTWHTWC